QRVQPAMVGLIDGSLSTLAPIFGVALASHNTRFSFHAEDGIRLLIVTGVQTCALPISRVIGEALVSQLPVVAYDLETYRPIFGRSEERRVGKECRSRRTRRRCNKEGGRSAPRQHDPPAGLLPRPPRRPGRARGARCRRA